MALSRDERQDEPNVVPLIDVSLVILVMALVISSVAGRLLPLELPKAETARMIAAQETVSLAVSRDGAGRLGAEAPLPPADLAAALGRLRAGTIVLLSAEPGARYEHVVAAIDAVRAHPGLKVAFGRSAGGPAAPAGENR